MRSSMCLRYSSSAEGGEGGYLMLGSLTSAG